MRQRLARWAAFLRRFAGLDMLNGADMPFHPNRIAVVLLVLSFCACGRPPAESSSSSADSQKLPFDRNPRATGISPSRSVIPSTTKIPEGTAIPVRLQSALSSVSSHAGDTFSAILDEPIIVDGQTLIARGTSATGRVLEAKPAASWLDPGYLRIVVVSLNVQGKPVIIYTSSIFVKGGSREERSSVSGPPSDLNQKDRDKDVVFGIDRRLNFRLAQSVDLQ